MNPIPHLMLTTPPSSEPLTLAEAKLFLRIDGSSEDALVSSLIAAARQKAEEYLRRSLITQTWTLSYDDYAPSETPLLRGPVQEIESVTGIDRLGMETAFSSANYYLNAAKNILVFDAVPISHRGEIAYTAGYGDASDIPAPIRQGIIQHMGALYEEREGAISVPAGIASLYDSYRIVRV